MKVYHFDGLDECLTEDELGSLLEARFGARANEFLLAGEREYPYLAILVNDGYSAMVYFPEDRESMFQAIGANTALSADGTSVFYSGNKTKRWKSGTNSSYPSPWQKRQHWSSSLHCRCQPAWNGPSNDKV